MNFGDVLNAIYNFQVISIAGYSCLVHRDIDKLITIKTATGTYQGVIMFNRLGYIKLVDYIFEKVYNFTYEEIIELK